MAEKYSNGFKSEVFWTTPEERKLFPRADLVKRDPTDDRLWFNRFYYRHKIASLMFPGNFIDVVGASVEMYRQSIHPEFAEIAAKDPEFGLRRIHKLFSKEADVSPEHAAYASHLESSITPEWVKESNCRCQDCQTHAPLHRTEKYLNAALEVADKVGPAGLWVDTRDPSDYCISKDEKLIFFEIDDFNETKVEEYLESLTNTDQNTDRATKLLRRYRESLRISRDEMLYGEGKSLKVN